MPDNPPASPPAAQTWIAYAVLFLFLGAAYWAYDGSKSRLEDSAQHRFDVRVNQVKLMIEDRVLFYEQVLRGAQGLFAASTDVTREEWRSYISSLNITKNYPGLVGVGYVSGGRGRMVMTYIEPEELLSEQLGFDYSSDTAARRPAAELARDLGQPAATSKITQAAWADTRAGFVLLLPIYRAGMMRRTVEERQAAIQGWVSGLIRIGDMLNYIVTENVQDVGFELYDGIEMNEEALIFTTESSNPTGTGGRNPTFFYSTPIEVGGRLWMLNFFSRPAFDEQTDRTRPYLVLSGGILASLLFFSVVRSLLVTRQLAMGQAERMTAELRRAQKDLVTARDIAEDANRAKSEFLADMSHELRAPLNSVMGFANILLQNKNRALKDDDLAYVDRILDNGKHLLKLLNQVLDLSKVEAGQADVEIEPLYLDFLIKETIAQMEGHALSRGITLRSELPKSMSPIETDATKLRQILINLISNAIKFTESGSVLVRVTVELKTRRPVQIDVIDTGVGIPQDRLKLIFEPFQQGDRRIARQYGGTGLGLSVSRSLCQLLGYDIKVESKVGAGSTFSVRIPRETRVKSSDSKAQPGARAGDSGSGDTTGGATFAGKLALVIDDDPDSRLLMSHFLVDLGLNVITAGSGEQGLDIIRSKHPDLVTVDLVMKNKSGWEVVYALKADGTLDRLPVVVVSTIGEDNRKRLPPEVDILNKPVAPEDLTRIVRERLGARPKG